MKKINYFFVLIVFLVFCLPVFQIQAKAIFPDKKALQPPAEDAFPNISNNINFNSEQQLYLQSDDYNANKSSSEQEESKSQETLEQKRINNELFWFIISIVLVCCFLVVFFIMYKKYRLFFQKTN